MDETSYLGIYRQINEYPLDMKSEENNTNWACISFKIVYMDNFAPILFSPYSQSDLGECNTGLIE